MTENREKGGMGIRGPLGCAEVRDLLPLRQADALGGLQEGRLDAHLAACAECAGEARFVEQLRDARPEPPAELSARIATALASAEGRRATPSVVGSTGTSPRLGSRRPTWGWGLAAAASVVVAVGVGVLWQNGETPSRQALLSAMAESGEDWESEEWMVAGAPVWEALSDEVLIGLLIEEDI